MGTTATQATVFFASAIPEKMDRNLTLPAKFTRLLEKMPIRERVKGRTVAIKMHLGGGLGYSTIHPFFVKLLVDHIRAGKPKAIFVTDGSVAGCESRGYAVNTIGAKLVPALGKDGKDVVSRRTGWQPLPVALLGRPLLQADVLVNFSHLKGHGDCGFGGACKNLGMGCVPQKTRAAIHGLEGKLTWRKTRCTHCNRCIKECPTHACKFDDKGEFGIFWHHCKMCQHCMLICPAKAIHLTGRQFDHFQEALARVAKLVVDQFEPGRVFHINLLTNITPFCDCWGLTTPALVPDIGVYASEDIVAVDDASLRAIKVKDLIRSALIPPFTLGKGRHLFEKIHSRDPFRQVQSLAKLHAGTTKYKVITVK